MIAESLSVYINNYLGLAGLTIGNIAMFAIAGILLYLGIVKHYEPLLLVPIAVGIILGNIPLTGLTRLPTDKVFGGLLHYIGFGTWNGLYPPLIFIGIGALTDFSALIANPITILLGAAGQFGIFAALLGAVALGFSPQQAGGIGIIGGADGPTAIYTCSILSPEILAPVAVAAYSYIALVPLIQPPVIKALTTAEERAIMMQQLRPVSRTEKIVFPIIVLVICGLLVPNSIALIGPFMLGNILRESTVTTRLAKTAETALLDIITIFLMITVGASASADRFFSWQFLGILGLGLLSFIISTAAGVLFGKLMCWLSKGKINPMIGAAGVSAVPEAARLAQKLGKEANPRNYLLLHAMGPNVAGVIGSAVAAGVLISMLSV